MNWAVTVAIAAPLSQRHGHKGKDDHVAPHGIGAAFLLRAQKILEVVDEREV